MNNLLQRYAPNYLCKSNDSTYDGRIMDMINTLKIGLAASLFLLSAGCATTQELDNSQQEKINTVYIHLDSELPPKAIHQGTANSLSATLGGVVGGVLAQSVSGKDDLIDKYLYKHNIDIGDISRNAIKKAVLGNMKLADKKIASKPEDADSHLNVDVYIYGLGEAGGFTNIYKPILGIRVKLSDSNGTVIWQSLDSVTANTEALPGIAFDEYFDDPRVMKDSFSDAAKTIAHRISENM